MSEVTPAAPETPAAPAAPETPAEQPAQPAVKQEEQSLVDKADPNAAPAEPAAPAAQPDPAAPQAADDPKWYLRDGVGAEGDPPEWFKGDKYKTLEEQAKAYNELETRFGAFTGAPKDGVYKIELKEDLPVEFQTDHPLFENLNGWAKEAQLSQEGYNNLLTMFAQYELSTQPDFDQIKKDVGENADARINSASQWAKSNLSEDQYNAFRGALTQSNAAAVFAVVEALIGKTREVSMPKPSDDVPGATEGGLEEINKLHNAKNEDGQRKYDVDPKYREMVEQKRLDYFKSQRAAANR